ncbi:hypothetical protein [Streptomyces lunaelactis]|nr:hypothetical protein [Streptomyces lunaelactis]NUL26293.1 hypothetical protein [Streptomyces lunaelactis]
MTAFDERFPGLHLLQQLSEDKRGDLLRTQGTSHALGGVRLDSGVVAAVEKPEELDLPFAYRKHQGSVGEWLLQRPRAEEQLHRSLSTGLRWQVAAMGGEGRRSAADPCVTPLS